jgi:hypothetical protein
MSFDILRVLLPVGRIIRYLQNEFLLGVLILLDEVNSHVLELPLLPEILQ